MKRPSGKPQTTTVLGTAGIFTQFLAVFNTVPLNQFMDTIEKMTVGQFFTVFFPFALWVWSIIHDEDKK